MANLSITEINIMTKFRNFNRFPLRISFFWRYPTSMKMSELSEASQRSCIMKDMWRANNYSGVDGLMLSSLVKTFNFTPILVKPTGVDFGYKTKDGQFLGSFFRTIQFS